MKNGMIEAKGMVTIDTLLTRAAFLLLLVFSSLSWSEGVEEAAQEVQVALELTPNIDNGRKRYRLCVVCHRPEGWASADGQYPQIAGQLSSVLIKQLADIRARNRDNPTMRPFTSPRLLGGAQEIADVAAYISKLPMNPGNWVGPGTDLKYGESLYKDNCSDCHGEAGQGDEEDHIPLIQGQNYLYLLRQFEWIRTGQRRNADPKMVKQIKRFTARDISSVMDYVSRLQPSVGKLAQPGWHNPDFPYFTRGSIQPVLKGNRNNK